MRKTGFRYRFRAQKIPQEATKNVKLPGGGSAETVLSDKMEQNVCFVARFGISYK